MDNNSDVNPHVKQSGITYDPKKADKRIEEATGKPITEIRAGFDSVFNKFKMDLKQTIESLRQENNKLRTENDRLKSEIAKISISNGNKQSKMSRMHSKRK